MEYQKCYRSKEIPLSGIKKDTVRKSSAITKVPSDRT